MNVLVVGGGGIGSRHAQGLATTGNATRRVVVVDPDPSARAVVEQRYREVAGAGSPPLVTLDGLDGLDTVDGLDGAVDVAIVATTAAPRAAVTREVVERFAPGALILEKVLFQRRQEYQETLDLVDRAGVPTWVNLPRRYAPAWQVLVARLQAASGGELTVEGSGWGMACNAVHLLDMFRWADPDGTLEVSPRRLEPGVVPAKRPGCYEVLGTLEVRCGTVTGALSCADPERVDLNFTVTAGSTTWSVTEAADGTTVRTEGTPQTETYPTIPPQSRLTGSVVDELAATDGCGLPTLEHATHTHLALIDALLAHMPPEVVIDGRCPIT